MFDDIMNDLGLPGQLIFQGYNGAMANGYQNSINGGGPLMNPSGSQPSIGGFNGGLDVKGGGTLGGQAAKPPTAHSGIGGSGQGASAECMTSGELNPYLGGSGLGGWPYNLGLSDPNGDAMQSTCNAGSTMVGGGSAGGGSTDWSKFYSDSSDPGYSDIPGFGDFNGPPNAPSPPSGSGDAEW